MYASSHVSPKVTIDNRFDNRFAHIKQLRWHHSINNLSINIFYIFSRDFQLVKSWALLFKIRSYL